MAAIALPQYQMAVGKAKYAALKENAHAIKNAMDRYFLTNSSYTTSLDDLDTEVQTFMADGTHCYIGASTIYCNRKIFGVTMEYGVAYLYGQYRVCVAYTQNPNDKPNRLCQQETDNTGEEAGTWTTYAY